MCNDCAVVGDPSADAMRDYALAAAMRSNIDHVPVAECHVGVVAARSVRAGEELLLSCASTESPQSHECHAHEHAPSNA